MLFGLLNLPWWGNIVALLIMTQITIACVTLYLHRGQAHRALDFHPVISHFFRFWLWLTTGMVTKSWVAIHRKHHAKCETVEDPHSPQILGLKTVLWHGAELYRSSAKQQDLVDRYGQGTPDDWIERNIYTPYSAKGILLMLVVDLLLFGLPGITIWAIQMIWIPFFAAGIINGVGHYVGYRNFECPDHSRNIIPFAFIIGGEELHNNHHTFGTSAKFSVKPWEFDLGWQYIKILRFFGLAKVKKLPPIPQFKANKTQIDADTIRALITNRFEIMSHYAHQVMVPILKQKQKAAASIGQSAVFTKVSKLLISDVSLIDANDKMRLDSLFNYDKTLETVYSLRLKLQTLWERAATSQKDLVDALQEWCKQAEATGIDSLQSFVKQLKTYSAA